MKVRILAEFDHETDSYAAFCPELPGCTSAGDTEEEALDNIKEAIELYFQQDEMPLNNKHLYELTI